MAFEPLADAPPASLSYSQCQTAQFLRSRLFDSVRVLLFLFHLRRCRSPVRGIGGAPRGDQPCTCRAVTRDATLARQMAPPAQPGGPASRRSAVALSAQVPPPSPLPGPARRLHATSRKGWLRCRAFRVRGYRPRSTPHPAPPSGSLLESAPQRNVHVLPQYP